VPSGVGLPGPCAKAGIEIMAKAIAATSAKDFLLKIFIGIGFIDLNI